MANAATILTYLRWMDRSSLLSRREERISKPLPVVINLLLQDTGKHLLSPVLSSEATVCFNQGALVHLKGGDNDRAALLCQVQIEFCRKNYTITSEGAWLAGIIQPLINLARLEITQGHSASARRILSSLLAFVEAKSPMSLAGADLDNMTWKHLNEKVPSIFRIVENSFVMDTIRSFLFIEDYHGLKDHLELLKGLVMVGPQHDALIVEASLRCGLYFGEYHSALNFGTLLWKLSLERSKPDPALLLYLADIYAKAGSQHFALQVLTKVIQYSESSTLHLSPWQRRHLLYGIALRYVELSAYREAEAVISRLSIMVEEADDQIMSCRVSLLRLALSYCLPEQGSTIMIQKEQLWTLGHSCQYVAERTAYLRFAAVRGASLAFASDCGSTSAGNVIELLTRESNEVLPITKAGQCCFKAPTLPLLYEHLLHLASRPLNSESHYPVPASPA